MAVTSTDDILTNFTHARLNNPGVSKTNTVTGECSPERVWFCFKLLNYQGATVSFTINAYHAIGVVWSYDGGATWQRSASVPTDNGDTVSFSITFENKGTEVIVAPDYRVDYSEYYDYYTGLDSEDDCSVEVFGQSVESRDLLYLQITNPDIPNRLKRSAVLVSGLHPSEPCSLVFANCFVRHLMNDTPYSQLLRDRYVWHVIPMLNADGLYGGLGRYNANTVDLNREFESSDRSEPEAAALWSLLQRLYPKPEILFDMHGLASANNYVYKTPDFCVLNTTRKKLDRFFPYLYSHTGWAAARTSDNAYDGGYDPYLIGAAIMDLDIPALTLELAMGSGALSVVGLADEAKNLVKAVDRYFLNSR